MAEKKTACKDKRISTELNNALAALLQEGQRAFAIAWEDLNLPSQDEMRDSLKNLANRLSETLAKFSKELTQAASKAAPQVKESTKHASMEYDKQALRLHDEEAFANVVNAMQRIQSAMAESLKETKALMEKLRPEADRVSQQVKQVLQEKLKELNQMGEELAKEIEKFAKQ